MQEIKNILTKFQKGYDDKNPKNTPDFMLELFANRQDLLTLGTGSWEVCLNREEVEKLIHDDWDGGWGDFKIDIEGAQIEADGNVAWFIADCTVKYSFKDSDDNEYKRLGDWVKENAKNQNVPPKQRLAFLNWAISLLYHQREPSKRDYLWPSNLSGMLIKENNAWKIATLHFSVAKPNYPDERFEEIIGNYHEGHNHTKDKIIASTLNKADSNLLLLLNQLESAMKSSSLQFDPEQVIVFEAGHFSWLIALGTEKCNISENEIFEKSLLEIEGLFNSDLPPRPGPGPGDMMFQVKRNISYALKEAASGSDFTWPIRLTAVAEKTEDGYKLRHKHFSYPFYWIFEGKL